MVVAKTCVPTHVASMFKGNCQQPFESVDDGRVEVLYFRRITLPSDLSGLVNYNK